VAARAWRRSLILCCLVINRRTGLRRAVLLSTQCRLQRFHAARLLRAAGGRCAAACWRSRDNIPCARTALARCKHRDGRGHVGRSRLGCNVRRGQVRHLLQHVLGGACCSVASGGDELCGRLRHGGGGELLGARVRGVRAAGACAERSVPRDSGPAVGAAKPHAGDPARWPRRRAGVAPPRRLQHLRRAAHRQRQRAKTELLTPCAELFARHAAPRDARPARAHRRCLGGVAGGRDTPPALSELGGRSTGYCCGHRPRGAVSASGKGVSPFAAAARDA
jgi:hypothetical protein